MAALHFTAAANNSSLRHRHLATGTHNPRKPFLLISCFSTSFPSKPTRRKNHLRQKNLKTLTKPIIPKLPPDNPLIPIDSPPLQETKEPEIIEEIQESYKSENSELEVKVGNVGIVAKNPILKYGLWLVGAFVFQTVCAVWFFGDKNGVLNGSEETGKSGMKVGLNGNGAIDSDFYLDELEMEMKIEEIRVMAREAREKERLASKKNEFDSEESDESDEGKYSKSVIEEEVDDRLIKLRKKLESARDKKPVVSVGYSKKGELDDGDGNGNGALLFKKKYRFKDLPGDPIEKPKGFIGLDDNNVDKSKVSGNGVKGDEFFKGGNDGSDAVGLGEGEKLLEPSDVDLVVSDEVHVAEDDKEKHMVEVTESTNNTRKKVSRKQGKRKGVNKTKGFEREKNNGRSAVEAVKSKKLNADNLKGKGVEDDFWWLDLPYVLAIFMRRGNGEGGEGLYTLKSISSTKDGTSHMVAFEDRVDATNFCYLLESFFEDLEDFKADVVPLTVEELNEAVKTMRVIVVKRGQLRLYAGQPLAEAEMALRAMIKYG
ncbi:hypothetical protein BUALT_Bualt14G0066900 [Buddleja alternifolia]|uniref:Uncharacterized protein n=1 Tax=Buddleja alternifolia TaxID=168488 RepID=A0AAV6WIP3_9LAMI|nr:hypothetical protein BUALT_Bualt14G0066900 [Buddleja alternifolia]